jgi:hypothetical protein
VGARTLADVQLILSIFFFSLAKLEDIRDLWQAQENTEALQLLKVEYCNISLIDMSSYF